VIIETHFISENSTLLLMDYHASHVILEAIKFYRKHRSLDFRLSH